MAAPCIKVSTVRAYNIDPLSSQNILHITARWGDAKYDTDMVK